jgi:segregation and condensation protein B
MSLTSKTIEEIDDLKEKESIQKIEAVLFVAGKFLSLAEIVAATDLNPLIVKHLLVKLRDRYESVDSALELVNKEDLWKMDVRDDFAHIATRLATGAEEFTKGEQETLAIIAYKQPIKQSVVIKIRGNKAYDHIHKFIKLNLVKSKRQGHTNILTLSDEFYDYFHLTKQDKLSPETLDLVKAAQGV